ncbi:hypothetical protein POKO110462_15500 [Pontibacter korlensis]|uniref:Uncharacterized protein n=1 Tax=Pontibacter korlensis TaxID=400092 RepID=A0A0E3ZGS0_9BACT|nr:hypothetical protein PKOR_14780 [Pontibacter korlensis]
MAAPRPNTPAAIPQQLLICGELKAKDLRLAMTDTLLGYPCWEQTLQMLSLFARTNNDCSAYLFCPKLRTCKIISGFESAFIRMLRT